MMRVLTSISMQACSACAGDYEDPDRTAGEEFEDCWPETTNMNGRGTRKSLRAWMAQRSSSTSEEMLRESR